MKVIKSEEQAWYLLEDKGDLFLEGLYNHSFVFHGHPIKLNDLELKKFQERGFEFIEELYGKIQYSCPIHNKSNSEYKLRKVDSKTCERIALAIKNSNI